MALVFEEVWHKVSHHVQHSYKYGKLHDIAHSRAHDSDHMDGHGNVRHVRLAQELVNRAGGEFMTLGFLAFCVFMFNQTGGFESVASGIQKDKEHRRLASSSGGHSSSSSDEDYWHYPMTASDWLHLVEIVHMKLFVGMVFYFCLTSVVVRGSAQIIQKWEELRLRRLQERRLSSQGGLATEDVEVSSRSYDEEFARYITWRKYFFHRIVEWRDRRRTLFVQMLNRLEIDSGAANALERFSFDMEERCAFSSYLSLNVEYGVRDTISVHGSTWCVVIALFTIFALLHRYAEITLLDIMPPFFAVCFVVLWVMHRLVKKRAQQVDGWDSVKDKKDGVDVEADETSCTATHGSFAETSFTDGMSTKLIQRHNTEMILLRMLQVLLFLVCYTFSGTVMDIPAWKTHPDKVLLMSSLFALLFVLLAYMLPKEIPVFLALMSLPPYVDTLNFRLLKASIDDHMPASEVEACRSKSRKRFGMDAALPVKRRAKQEAEDGDDASLQSTQEAIDRINMQLEQLHHSERTSAEAHEAKNNELKQVWQKLKSIEGSVSKLAAQLEGSQCDTVIPNAVPDITSDQ
eukprot:gnl/MRDRNA2_/MRDRNA2_82678_c0_seq1.p1 gnl/MRDRNA2_/MRDRNA2_82678_c0~~gnl/MRDRNA2_/MRDRNA2_82678_c0_seq1.p1  ORF type:complete len:656 (+),score=112.68 gnl/MRDRNA2_/MRDRNA2_82678_c0_seq1:247-1968(+)